MGEDTQLTREQVLGCTRPSELFGAEAVANPRALKRAYAKLIRRFGPDTDAEAFEHVRGLYERAKHAPPRAVPDGVADGWAPEPAFEFEEGGGDPAPVRIGPVESLQRALHHEDWAQVAHHVDDAAGPIIHADPDLWLEAAWAVTDALLFEAPPAALEARLDTLGAVTHAVELPVLLEVEELILTGLAFDEAARDPRVSGALLDMVREAWPADVARAAQIWCEAGPELATSLDLELEVRFLETHHPLVHRCLAQVNARISDAETLHRVWMAGRRQPLPRFRARRVMRRLSPTFLEASGGAREAVFTGVLIVALLLGFIVAGSTVHRVYSTAAGGLHYLLACGGVCLGIFLLFTRFRPIRPVRVPTAWSKNLREEVVETLRDHTLWPHELVAAAMPGWDEVPPGTSRTLLDLEQDRSLLMASMTSAHVERMQSRLQKEASEA